MENFKLPRAYLRPETELGYEKEAWRPTWKCFCCQDSGLIKEHLVKKVIQGYDRTTDKLVRCNATDCEGKKKYDGEDIVLTGTLDCRFPTQLCDRFHCEEREMWRKWCKERHEQKKLTASSQKLIKNATKSLRKRERTQEEQLEAQRKHEEYN